MLLEFWLFTLSAVTGPGVLPSAVQVELEMLYAATFATVPSAKVRDPATMIVSSLLCVSQTPLAQAFHPDCERTPA